MASNLDHLERTFAEAYRKEIDQEENVWRSLPFFAATLALELTALFPTAERMPPHGSVSFHFSRYCLIATAACTIVALGLLALSIFPVRFRYVTPEPELLVYAEGLDANEAALGADGMPGPDSLLTFKTAMARQYANAADHNRQVNQRRARRRSVAGLAILASVFLTILLVAVTIGTYVPKSR